MKNKISLISRILLFLSAGLTIVILFLPIWSIYLDAPQYPEGLEMHIWANKLSGDVEIINGLNHYIGMKTIHVEDFKEFVVLPYMLIALATYFLVAAFVGTKRWLNIAFVLLVAFGVGVMIDFWIWLYDYGHELDPSAPIKVPGMSYQPPLIGFKQLLNFGAYSIPALGGWLAIITGGLLFIGVMIESKILKKFKKNKLTVVSLLMVGLTQFSCGSKQVEPIRLNTDGCDFCKMTISDGRFGVEIITTKGRVYKFDDLKCMLNYVNENESTEIASYYINNYLGNNELIDATNAFYLHHVSLNSPMRGNFAAFVAESAAKEYSQEIEADILTWNEILQSKANTNEGNHDNEHEDHSHHEHH
ncbi:MAG: nitrous oxide reductase accessory protein NosL [Crocinitomicaceae bacterium]|nr:nitrous oxide reductase accessory protein NosL [Crocinitomicaceae bacterium]